MQYESYFHLQNKHSFMIHSELKKNRPTILFIHGLGDSSLSYRPYLESSLVEKYNILIPDLLGYGKSSSSTDFSFAHQVLTLENHINDLQKKLMLNFSELILVAHSMGSIPATLFCESTFKNCVKAFINVEGSITQFGSFVAESMMSALAENRFQEWFHDFKEVKVYENLAQKFLSIRPYYASLLFCNESAFIKNASQMYEMSHELSGKYTHAMGVEYRELSMRKIYCYGDTMCKETLEFLRENNLQSQYFSCKHHFLLEECVDDFVEFIDGYINIFVVNNAAQV